MIVTIKRSISYAVAVFVIAFILWSLLKENPTSRSVKVLQKKSYMYYVAAGLSSYKVDYDRFPSRISSLTSPTAYISVDNRFDDLLYYVNDNGTSWVLVASGADQTSRVNNNSDMPINHHYDAINGNVSIKNIIITSGDYEWLQIKREIRENREIRGEGASKR